MNGIVRQLVAARREQHLTQADVAARMGCAQGAVANRESGTRAVRLDVAEAWAAALGYRLALIPLEGEEGAA
ncbi:helix-turn-helix domain-containing protein [Actinomadura sediminis]|uniref:Helix-turn-helix domain-containing protein n=1 Tax=Actinomadura sediminis TaxID=1038904 RepID=A0ABW3EPT5_9ACTN